MGTEGPTASLQVDRAVVGRSSMKRVGGGQAVQDQTVLGAEGSRTREGCGRGLGNHAEAPVTRR